ncbi:hypothetical protein INT45_012516, partial [Circinella minor]
GLHTDLSKATAVMDWPPLRSTKDVILSFLELKLNNNSQLSLTSLKNIKNSRTLTLKTKLTPQEKKELKSIFQTLDPNKFWYLEATIPEPGEKVKSIEERIIQFVLVFPVNILYSTSVSLTGLRGVFTKEERKEIENANCKLFRTLISSSNQQLSKLYKKKTVQEAYNFARRIGHDPEHDPLFSWLSSSLQNTALLFPYYINTLDYDVFSKEKSSSANAAATNQKRKLSAVEPVDNLKMGRRTNTNYIGGDGVELECLEVGKASDQTKEFMDGSIKMPIVMRDMLLKLAGKSPVLVNELHVLRYVIMGNTISSLGMDIPRSGYVTRSRCIKPVASPDSNESFVMHIGPLLELASIEKAIAEDTYSKFSS